MTDCKHPQLLDYINKNKPTYTVTLQCPDCHAPIGFLGERTREILMNMGKFKNFKTSSFEPDELETAQVGTLHGIPIFVSYDIKIDEAASTEFPSDDYFVTDDDTTPIPLFRKNKPKSPDKEKKKIEKWRRKMESMKK